MIPVQKPGVWEWLKKNRVLPVAGFCIILLVTGMVCGDQANLSGRQVHINGTDLFTGSGAESDISLLLSFLDYLGMDTSYGNGTIFSMMDQSLTRIIMDLSSGNTEGFRDNPLISETLKYANYTPGDIIVTPEDAPESLDVALRNYQQYGKNTPAPNGSQQSSF